MRNSHRFNHFHGSGFFWSRLLHLPEISCGSRGVVFPEETTLSTSNQEAHVNWEQAKGQWMQMKGAVRKQWGKLTDDDLDVIHGERERLVGKIQERYGIAKEEAERQVAAWNLPAEATREQQRKAS
jgi:uncharacterized protein YjbJ (UPF0337 family)